MTTANRKKRRSKVYILVYLYMLLILMSLLTVASYTWFSLTKTPRVSDLNMYITSVSGLELSEDPGAEEWKLQLDFRDLVSETAPLRPITWSEQEQRFYAAGYGIDGRLVDTSQWQPLSDSRNANKTTLDGYYVKITFYARTGQTVNATFSPPTEVNEGMDGAGTYVIGKPVWDAETVTHKMGGQGAEHAVRIGLRATPVDETGTAVGEAGNFFIYEPNCTLHYDGPGGYMKTPSIDGTETLVPEEQLILQGTSFWSERSPVERDKVDLSLGDFLEDTMPTLFQLDVGEIMQLDLYVWVEGQDYDCNNQMTAAQIIANVQFTGTTDVQSGMQIVE